MSNSAAQNSPGIYQPQAGWVQTPFWETYAGQFASDGSEEQLMASLTHSAPQDWLNNWYKQNNVGDEPFNRQMFDNMAMNFAPYSKMQTLEDPSAMMSNYSQALQKRLRGDFDKNFNSYLDRGKANLRAQSQQNLESDQANIDQNANSRGMYFSGKRQSARAGAAANRANELGQATTQYEQNLNDTRRNLMQNDFSGDINSLLQQADMNSIASGAFYDRLKNQMTNNEAMMKGYKDIGSGFGNFAGSMFGFLGK